MGQRLHLEVRKEIGHAFGAIENRRDDHHGPR
jgi:hypothetical protein